MKIFYVGQALLPWRQTKSQKEIRAVSGLTPVIQSTLNFQLCRDLCPSGLVYQHINNQLPRPGTSHDANRENTPCTHEETTGFYQLKKEQKNQSDVNFQLIATLSCKISFWEQKAALWPSQ